MRWPWHTPGTPNKPPEGPDYGPAVHALTLHVQKLDANVRSLQTEWLDHAVRMEGLVRKMLRLPTPAGNGQEEPPAAPVPAPLRSGEITRSDLLRRYREKGGRT